MCGRCGEVYQGRGSVFMNQKEITLSGIANAHNPFVAHQQLMGDVSCDCGAKS